MKLSVFFMTLALMVSSMFGATITGTVNFGSPVANITIPNVNTGTFIGSPSFTVITPATGDFAVSLGSGGTATNITGNFPLASFLTFNGFTVDVTSFSGSNVWTQTTLPNNTTFLSLGFNGVVKKAGYEDTLATGAISAQYSGAYDPQAVVAWSGNLNASGQSAVPEPATYALMGAGLVILGAIQRRRRQNN